MATLVTKGGGAWNCRRNGISQMRNTTACVATVGCRSLGTPAGTENGGCLETSSPHKPEVPSFNKYLLCTSCVLYTVTGTKHKAVTVLDKLSHHKVYLSWQGTHCSHRMKEVMLYVRGWDMVEKVKQRQEPRGAPVLSLGRWEGDQTGAARGKMGRAWRREVSSYLQGPDGPQESAVEFAMRNSLVTLVKAMV
jgi:hypothetical protein